MKFIFCNVLVVFLYWGHSYGQYDFRTLPQEYRDRMGNVSEILNGTTPLTVMRAKYKKERHAVCVRSRRLEISNLGFHHNLSYFMKGSKIEPKERGEWRKRDTYFYVGPKNKYPTVVIYAYMDHGRHDPEISGDYYLLYGKKPCFVLGTMQRQDNSSCLLWEQDGTLSKPHEICL
ncbi:hypothetical protein MTO96_037739, partial [Rhipicephalus appendiculatus]